MRLTISAVGRLKAGPEKELVESYTARIRQMGPAVSLGPLSLHEVESKKRQSGGLAKDAKIVALDERGENWSSTRFAERLGQWRDGGVPETVFVIGGHDGLDPSLQRDVTMSFGQATWPHLLVRVMLLEQIFRAITILSGHPYHRA